MPANHTLVPILFRPATPQDRAEITELWAACGLTRPWNDPASDFDFALSGPASTILAGTAEDQIIASAMVGHDGHRGCVYYVSVHPDHQGRGLGQLLMNEAETWLRDRGVPKLNLIVRSENEQVVGFYESIGYLAEPNTQMGKRLDTR